MDQTISLLLLIGLSACASASAADRLVTRVDDRGPGSLRQAILDANATPGADRIRFDSVKGPFAEPRRIRLDSALPAITDELEIDGYIEDRLWEATGITIDGDGRHAVFRVGPDVRLRIRHLAIAGGSAPEGGGLATAGTTEVEGVSFFGNRAERGGAVAQTGGRLWLVNSSFWDNHAAESGGAVALLDGEATVVHATLDANRAPTGANLYNRARLALSNSILAHGIDGADCVSAAPAPTVQGTRNLIMRNDGCGTPYSSEDPRLGKPGLYNGPAPTIPLLSGSPAINWADPAASVDAKGERLVWDQRGNGDPRDAAGLPDLGAFEEQAVTVLEVDVADDVERRGCSSMVGDCSLRGAIAVANASPRHDAITFRPALVREHRRFALAQPLPTVTATLSIRAPQGVELEIAGPPDLLPTAPGATLDLQGIQLRPTSP